MNFETECAALIQRHLLATTGREWPIDVILAQPRHKRVWAWWKALSYFKIDNSYASLDDAPEGIESITVMSDSQKMYKWIDGRYELIQEITEKDCRSVYGE